jgi:hypothetical protein
VRASRAASRKYPSLVSRLGCSTRTGRIHRQFLRLVAASAAACSVTDRMGEPARPVRLLVGFTPGSGADVTARLIAQWLSARRCPPERRANSPGPKRSRRAVLALLRDPRSGVSVALLQGWRHILNSRKTDHEQLVRDYQASIATSKSPLMTGWGVRRGRQRFPVCAGPTRQQPGATGAATEATKWLKPFG